MAFSEYNIRRRSQTARCPNVARPRSGFQPGSGSPSSKGTSHRELSRTLAFSGVGRIAGKGGIVVSSVKVPCERIGFTPPPVRLSVRFLPARSAHAMLVAPVHQPDGAANPAILSWLEAYGPTEVLVKNGRVFRAMLSHLPPAWEELTRTFQVVYIVLDPSGDAILRLQGQRADVRTFLGHNGHAAAAGGLQRIASEGSSSTLTPRQDHVIREAAARGFYAVPRKINLTDLAAELRISPGSLSEILRRAEARLIRDYAGRDGASERENEDPTDSP